MFKFATFLVRLLLALDVFLFAGSLFALLVVKDRVLPFSAAFGTLVNFPFLALAMIGLLLAEKDEAYLDDGSES